MRLSIKSSLNCRRRSRKKKERNKIVAGERSDSCQFRIVTEELERERWGRNISNKSFKCCSRARFFFLLLLRIEFLFLFFHSIINIHLCDCVYMCMTRYTFENSKDYDYLISAARGETQERDLKCLMRVETTVR